METPTTQKGQIESLLGALNVPDVTAALAVIPQLQGAQTNAQQWQTQRQALFASLGGSGNVPEHYDFATAIAGAQTDRTALWAKLGATDQPGAVLALDNLRTQINNLQAVQTSVFGALKATDHAGAMRAINDIDGRIEAGVQAGVIERAASAGLTTPVDKGKGDESSAGGTAKTATRAEFDAMNATERLAFSQAGGKVSVAA